MIDIFEGVFKIKIVSNLFLAYKVLHKSHSVYKISEMDTETVAVVVTTK